MKALKALHPMEQSAPVFLISARHVVIEWRCQQIIDGTQKVRSKQVNLTSMSRPCLLSLDSIRCPRPASLVLFR